MGGVLEEAYYSRDVQERKPHYHHSHQILLILAGETEICVNGVSSLAGPGKLVLFSRYENHAVTVRSKSYERFVLQIRPPEEQREERIFAVLSNRPKGFGNVIDVADDLEGFRVLMAAIVEEFAGKQSMAEEMCQLLTRQLLVRICRRCPEILELYESEKNGLVFDLQRRFETKFSENYQLQKLAKEYATSVSSLSHRFKAVTGLSVMEYLLSCRIAAAKQYLTQSKLEIGQIVELCGFSDCSNFSRTFKRVTGMSPSGFRERYGQKEGTC